MIVVWILGAWVLADMLFLAAYNVVKYSVIRWRR